MKITKTTKIVLIIISVIIVAGIAAAAYFYKFKKQEVAPVKTETQTSTAEQVAAIVDKGDFSACDLIQDADYKIVCKNNIAENLADKNLDTSWCLKLDDKNFSRENCIQSVVFGKAKKQGDPNTCNEAGALGYKDDVDKCLTGFWTDKASKESNKELCNNIIQEAGKTNCLNQVAIANFFKDPEGSDCSKLAEVGITQSDCKSYQENKNCDLLTDRLLIRECQITGIK